MSRPFSHLFFVRGTIEAESLDLIPSTYHLLFMEENNRQKEGQPPYYIRFFQRIKILLEQYDFIILDCPPNIYKATKCGLFASDHVIVPCNPDALSWLGLDLLSKLIRRFGQRIEEEFNGERPGDPLPLISGVIVNDVQPAAKRVNRFSEEAFQKRLSGLKKEGYAVPNAELVPVRVRHAAAFQLGSFNFRPVMFSEPSASNLLEDYRNIALYFMDKLKR